MEDTLIARLEDRARQSDPTVVRLPGEDRDTDLRELLDRARFLAGDLHEAGVRPGDVVGIVLQNGTGFLTTLFGLMYAGAVPAPLALPNSLGGMDAYRRHLAAVARDCDMRFLVTDTELRRLRDRLAATLADGPTLLDLGTLPHVESRLCLPLAPDRPGFVQYTSGSTSAPKGVLLSQRALAAGVEAIVGAARITRADTIGLWLPLFHDMGLVSVLVGLLAAGKLALWRPGDFIRRPDQWLTAFAEERCTVCTAPNFFYDHLIGIADRFDTRPLDLSAWRVACNGAEPVQPHTVEEFARRFAAHGFVAGAVCPVYGMAEATLAVTFSETGKGARTIWRDRAHLRTTGRAVPAEPGSAAARPLVGVGRPVPGMRVRIASPGVSGGEAPAGHVGEIQITGPAVTSGYHRRPRAEAFTTDGWLRTGDLGFLDDGELFVTGREKSMVVIRGENYHAEDAEALARDLPGVYRHRCVAIPWTDPDGGETLAVVTETALTGAEERADLVQRIAAALTAGLGLSGIRVRLVDPHRLPQTSSGKIRRNRARDVLDTTTD
ncbi:AMP-binding protein [Kitasatospora sp. NPDC094011]|uniref:AMP-binding protein n=1 Tax=Kitasatospora sp. NPDC094011 TaxID=3364090 RepID=UPI00380C586E